jgi:hypothetical protein
MIRHRLSVPAALCAVLFAGCSSVPSYAALAIEDDAEMTNNVTVTDSELRDIVRVGGRPFVERIPGSNQLKVTVTIRNIDDEPIQILAQVSFLNERKEPIGDDTNKQVKLLAPGDTITHTAISKMAEARDWQLRLSWNR